MHHFQKPYILFWHEIKLSRLDIWSFLVSSKMPVLILSFFIHFSLGTQKFRIKTVVTQFLLPELATISVTKILTVLSDLDFSTFVFSTFLRRLYVYVGQGISCELVLFVWFSASPINNILKNHMYCQKLLFIRMFLKHD